MPDSLTEPRITDALADAFAILVSLADKPHNLEAAGEPNDS
jgi:hypothetical protein